ncbi:hypothetical protein CMI47_20230 [Candidatus Pacearchaeota archaeon]|nr:hypothetical protein [Candidatus Pacearchaeota archaeon]|tara:strand:- start:3885 stop:4292 length:408 start_codon:yes stop_codon:yes gene_type:complete
MEKVSRSKLGTLEGITYNVPIHASLYENEVQSTLTKMYVTINGKDGCPLEVFINIAKSGSHMSIMADAIGRLTSGWLQDGADPERILKHLLHMKCGTRVSWPKVGAAPDTAPDTVLSIPDGVAKALQRWIDAQTP